MVDADLPAQRVGRGIAAIAHGDIELSRAVGVPEGARGVRPRLWDDAATRKIALTVTRGRYGAPTNNAEVMDHFAKMQLEVDVAAWECRREKLTTGDQVGGEPRETG